MQKRRLVTFFAWVLTTLTLLTVGTQLFERSTAAQVNGNLLVSAAISLKDSLQTAKTFYKTSQPAVKVTYNFGASGALQRQIENGAPVDLFISAGKKQMDALEQAGLLVPGTRRNLVSNRIVLIVPNNTSGISSFRDLTSDRVKRIAVGEPRSVPAGQYAEEVFQNLGILSQVKAKSVLGINVRQVLAAVESGNVDAGVVYATDAAVSSKVKVVAIAPDKLHSPIVYPAAILSRTKNMGAAKSYLQFLSSRQATAIFQKYGFRKA